MPPPTLSRRALFGVVGLAAPVLARAQTVVQSVLRGPFLVVPTPTSMTVRWRTAVATSSIVRYGTSVTGLTDTAGNFTNSTTEHSVTLTGLSPDVRYYYAVGDAGTTLAGGDASYSFRTFPTSGTTRASRIWVVGDAGTGFADQTAARDAYAAYTGSNPTHLWLQLGDNAYDHGLDADFQARLFGVYASMLRSCPTLSTIGNHDTDQSTSPAATIPYFSIYDAPSAGQAGGLASGSTRYYSFNLGHIHFVCLDSMTSSRATTGTMLTWLKNDLAANTLPWVVAYWHHAPYSDGSHVSDSTSEVQMTEMRTNALPILESHGVDLVLGGHSHVYERSCLINGHYGLSSTLTARMKYNAGNGRLDGNGAYLKPLGKVGNRGTVYIVNGASGGADPGNLKHPAMVFSAQRAGSVVIDVSGTQMDVKYIAATGGVLDYFTIQKTANAPDPPPPNVAPTIALTAPTSGSSFRAPANITLTAAATDADSGIAKVEFYRGSTRVATVTTAPYLYVLPKVARGSYTLTAKAYDKEGAVTTSAPVTVTVR
ncbi:Ig-like domain-containing protein [Sphaerotilus microaerophilus]|uniref:Metallophosphoesterase n=1 Tax=Sphaerotilus microaerophilus TaxID=2914710 RepID=A0ABN6PIH3_9BURK|nr:Ig-like domain-containing protein [Sphaerotilus sp. FB-5]BDI03430.1 hypothetical protein CATMQ487_04000 [Sphaerotilus sp. FB-5]